VDDELRPYLEGIWHEPVAIDALAGLLAAERQAFGQGAARPGVDLLWALARRARRARAGGRCRTGRCGYGSSTPTEYRALPGVGEGEGWVRRAAVVLGAAAVGLVVDPPPAQPARMTTTTANRVIARIGGTFPAISGRVGI
jgi:hypothetical protein